MKREYLSPLIKYVTINVKDDLATDKGGTTSDQFVKPSGKDDFDDDLEPQTDWDN